jgi:nitrogen fixation NifU-like protein
MSTYSDIVMDHFQSPRNEGTLELADLVGIAGVPGQGRFVVIYLKLAESIVCEARFQSQGCGATIASASMLTECIIGRSLDQCQSLTAEHLLEALEGLPSHKQSCAGFAIEALRNAIFSARTSLEP